MAVKLLFFAQCADWMKQREYEVQLKPSFNKVMDIVNNYSELSPLLEHIESLKIAVNLEYADLQTMIKDGDEIAFLPPFSGG